MTERLLRVLLKGGDIQGHSPSPTPVAPSSEFWNQITLQMSLIAFRLLLQPWRPGQRLVAWRQVEDTSLAPVMKLLVRAYCGPAQGMLTSSCVLVASA